MYIYIPRFSPNSCVLQVLPSVAVLYFLTVINLIINIFVTKCYIILFHFTCLSLQLTCCKPVLLDIFFFQELFAFSAVIKSSLFESNRFSVTVTLQRHIRLFRTSHCASQVECENLVVSPTRFDSVGLDSTRLLCRHPKSVLHLEQTAEISTPSIVVFWHVTPCSQICGLVNALV
jgi:hypothetical protein